MSSKVKMNSFRIRYCRIKHHKKWKCKCCPVIMILFWLNIVSIRQAIIFVSLLVSEVNYQISLSDYHISLFHCSIEQDFILVCWTIIILCLTIILVRLTSISLWRTIILIISKGRQSNDYGGACCIIYSVYSAASQPLS